MLFLVFAILSSSAISIIMRISSDKVSGNLSMLAVNYLTCAILGAAYTGFDLAVPETPGSSLTVGLGILNGILYLASFVLFQINTHKNGVVLSAIFMRLGLLIPIVVSVLFFHEIPTWLQIAGFCIAIGAIVLINLKKESSGKGFHVGLIALLFMGGSADAMSKIFETLGTASLSDLFLFYTFAVAFVLCVGLVIGKKERPGFRELLFGVLIGIPNFFSSKFLLGALATLPAVVVYPSFSVATMLIVTLTGVVVFRERLKKFQWLAVGAIIVALILLNI